MWLAILFGLIALEFIARWWDFPDFAFSFKRTTSKKVPNSQPINHQMLIKIINSPFGQKFNDITVTLNKYAFRGGEISESKPDNEIRVFLVGDSVIADWQYTDSECLSTRLQEMLNKCMPSKKFNVQNVAHGGESIWDSTSMVVNRVLPLKPDIIIYLQGGSEFITSKEEKAYHYGVHKDELKIEYRNPVLYFYIMSSYSYLCRAVFQLYRKIYKRQVIFSLRNGKPEFIVDLKERLAMKNKLPLTDKFSGGEYMLHAINQLTAFLAICKSFNIKTFVTPTPFIWKPEKLERIEDENFFFSTSTGDGKHRLYQHVAYQHYQQLVNAMKEATEKSGAALFGDLRDVIPKDRKYWIDDCHTTYEGTSCILNYLQKVVLDFVKNSHM